MKGWYKESYRHYLAGKGIKTARNKSCNTKMFLAGGLADKKKVSDFDPKALAKGTKVEMEHTKNEEVARKIAMDHLTEHPKYYDQLEKMEKKLKYMSDKLEFEKNNFSKSNSSLKDEVNKLNMKYYESPYYPDKRWNETKEEYLNRMGEVKLDVDAVIAMQDDYPGRKVPRRIRERINKLRNQAEKQYN